MLGASFSRDMLNRVRPLTSHVRQRLCDLKQDRPLLRSTSFLNTHVAALKIHSLGMLACDSFRLVAQTSSSFCKFF